MNQIIVVGDIFESNGHDSMAGRVYSPQGLCPSLGASHFQQVKYILEKNNLTDMEKNKCLTEQNRTEQNRTEQNSCLIRQATKEGVIECMLPGIADLDYPNSETRRGRVQEKGQICPTLTTENIPSVLEEWIWEVDGVKYLIRIRKLTPRECGRLMGVSDDDITKILDTNSNTQAYKQFGNSIVVDVMENIFREMLPDEDWSQYMNPPKE